MTRVLLLALLPLAALAQGADPAPVAEPRKDVAEWEFDDFDLESLKAGEWTLEEFVSEEKQKDGTLKRTGNRTRRACVKADKDRVWIELSTWDLEAKQADVVFLCEADRKTRKVLKSWRSEKGERGKEVPVKADPRPAVQEPDGQGMGSTIDETRQVGANKVRCAGIALQKVKWSSAKGNEPAPKITLVFSTEPPFRIRLDDADACSRHLVHAKRPAGTLAGKQALVEVAVDDPEKGRSSVKLTDFGADAKATVKK